MKQIEPLNLLDLHTRAKKKSNKNIATNILKKI